MNTWLLVLFAVCLLSFCSVNAGLLAWVYSGSDETETPQPISGPPVSSVDKPKEQAVATQQSSPAPAPPTVQAKASTAASGYVALAFDGDLEGAGARKRSCLSWQGSRGSNAFYEWKDCELVDKSQIFKMEGVTLPAMEVKGFEKNGVMAESGVKLSNLASGSGVCLGFAGAQRQPIGVDCASPDAPLFLPRGDSMFSLHQDGSMDCLVQGTRSSPIIFRPGTCRDTERMVFALNIPAANVEHAMRDVTAPG